VQLVELDLDTGYDLRHLAGVWRAAVSAQDTLVTSDSRGGIVVRDQSTLEPVATLAGSRGSLDQLVFDRDGQVLMASGQEELVELYDTATWTRLAEIPAAAREGDYEGWLRPDGKAVAINGEHGVVEWTLDPRKLAAAACEVAGRNMTRAEWATYLPDQPYQRTCPDYPAGT
jgi:hypothetical protein